MNDESVGYKQCAMVGERYAVVVIGEWFAVVGVGDWCAVIGSRCALSGGFAEPPFFGQNFNCSLMSLLLQAPLPQCEVIYN